MFTTLENSQFSTHSASRLVEYCIDVLCIGRSSVLASLLNIKTQTLNYWLNLELSSSGENNITDRLRALYNVLCLIEKYNIDDPPLNIINESLSFYHTNEYNEICFNETSLLGLIIDNTKICLSPQIDRIVSSIAPNNNKFPSSFEERVARLASFLEKVTHAPVYAKRRNKDFGFVLDTNRSHIWIRDTDEKKSSQEKLIIHDKISKQVIFEGHPATLESFFSNIFF